MLILGLENEYIQYLDEKHYPGYARNLFFINEKEYYRGMFFFLTTSSQQETQVVI